MRQDNKDQFPDPSNSDRNTGDLPDSPQDAERLKPDETTIDLPDVKDIPGQEFVQVPRMSEFEDTTISSADEEGEGLFIEDEEDETAIVMGSSADVSKTERELLENSEEYMPTHDEENLQRARMDNTDFEGVELNEGSFGRNTGSNELDIPEENNNTDINSIGQDDEENNHYSLGGEHNDDNETRS